MHILADTIAAGRYTHMSAPHYAKKVWGSMLKAQKFVLTNEAAERVGEAIEAYPDMLVDHSQFARAPFPTTWIEADVPSINKGTSPFLDSDLSDTTVGYLIVDNKVLVFSANGEKDEGIMMPFHYKLHTPFSLESEIRTAEHCGISRSGLDRFFWGKRFYERIDDAEIRKGLRLNHSFEMQFAKPISNTDAIQDLMMGSAGDLRNILGLLLMINQPKKFIDIRQVAASSKFTSRGRKKYFAHSTVSLTLNNTPVIRLVSNPTSERCSPRRHEVRGHYCHDKQGRVSSHEHNWIEVEPLKWECSKCKGKRWWRKAFGRGDAAKGYVIHDYKVSKDGED